MTILQVIRQKIIQIHAAAFTPKYLIFTNVGISIILSMIGDTLEQSWERYDGELEKWDRTRTIRMGISGMTVGIVSHNWYRLLDRMYPKRTLGVVIRKIILDQTICSPIYIMVFFLTMGLLEDNSWAEVLEEIKEKAWRLYIAEWTVWPMAQFVNFFLIPPKYRVFFDGSISVGYDMYMSSVKYRKSPKSDDSDKEKVKQTRSRKRIIMMR